MAVVTKTLRGSESNQGLSRTSNVVTVTRATSPTETILVGDTVVIAGVTPSSFNGTFTVTGVTGTTSYTYDQTAADESSTVHGTTGGDYSSFVTWEATEQTNLVTDTDSHVLECYTGEYDAASSGYVYLDGWTFDATYNLTIKAAAGHEHRGVYNAGVTLYNSGTSGNALRLNNASYITIQDIQIENSRTGNISSAYCLFISNTGNFLLSRLFVVGNSGTSYACIWYGYDTRKAHNCIFYCDYSRSLYIQGGGTNEIYNCTLITGATQCFYGLAGNIFKNCVGASPYLGEGGWRPNTQITYNAASSNNATTDTDAGDVPSGDTITGINYYDTFIDPDNMDFRLKPDSPLVGVGADMSGSYTTDVAGKTRYGDHIGAFANVALRKLRLAVGDYTSISTWESTEQTDLTADGYAHVLWAYDDWPTGLVDSLNLTGWTTSVEYPISIVAAPSNRTNGIPPSSGNHEGFLLKETGGAGTHAIEIDQSYVSLSGIAAYNTGTGSSSYALYVLSDYVYVDGCTFEASASSSRTVNISSSHSSGGTNFDYGIFRNSTVYHNNPNTSYGALIGSGVSVDNNTIVNLSTPSSVTGFGNADASHACRVRNTLVFNFTTDIDYNAGNTGDYNASSDSTAADTNSLTGVTTAAFSQYASGNYTITQASVLYGAGQDLSPAFYTDLKGSFRDVWSIGAFDDNAIVKTLRIANGDYSSLATWESTEQADLTTSGYSHRLECYSDWSDTGLDDSVVIAGWTTSAATRLQVVGAAKHRPENTANAILGFYVNYLTGGGPAIEVQTSHTDLKFFSIYGEKELPTTSRGVLINAPADGDSGCDGIIVRGIYEYGIKVVTAASASLPCYVRNCMVSKDRNPIDKGIWHDGSAGGTAHIYNCVVASHYIHGTIGAAYTYGKSGATNCPVVNCASYGAVADYVPVGNDVADYCATDLAESVSGLSFSATNNISGLTQVDFSAADVDDFSVTLQSKLYHAGQDLSSTFTNEFRGLQRLDPVWHIGFNRVEIKDTFTLKTSGGDYSSLVTFEADQQQNLWGTGNNIILECYAGTYYESVDFWQWGIYPSEGLIVRAEPNSHHRGRKDQGVIIQANNSSEPAVWISDGATTLEGLVIRNSSSTDRALICDGDYAYIDNCILTGYGSGQPTITLRSKNCYIRGCLIDNENIGNYGFWNPQSASDVSRRNYLINSSIVNCALIAIYAADFPNQLDVYNTLTFNAGSADWFARFDVRGSNNAATNTYSIGPNAIWDITADDFVDAANDNFAIHPASKLFRAGADVTQFGITKDVRGLPITEFPIGAFSNVEIASLRSSGGDYSVMSTWEATEQRSLLTDNEIILLEVYNDWPTGLDDGVTITGWATNQGCFIAVQAAAGHGALGRWGRGFKMKQSNTQSAVLNISQVYTWVRGFELEHTGSGTRHALTVGAANATIDAMMLHRVGAGGGMFQFNGNDTTITNSVILGESGADGLTVDGTYTGIQFIGNTVVSYDSYAIDWALGVNTTIEFHNNVLWGALGTEDTYLPKQVANFNNAFGTDQIFGTDPVFFVTSADFMDVTSDDFRIKDSSQLYGAGVSFQTGFAQYDVTGRARTAWSIGAFEDNTALRTLRANGGDYSLLSSWESGEQTDLTASGDKHILECYADWPSGLAENVDIDGWNANATYTLTIKAAAGHEHNGVVGAGFILTNSGSIDTLAISTVQLYTTIQDIELRYEGTGSYEALGVAVGLLQRCILYANPPSSASCRAMLISAADGTTARNNLFLAGPNVSGSVISWDRRGDTTFLNNTVMGNFYGYSTDSNNAVFRNNVFYGTVTNIGTTWDVAEYNAFGSTGAFGTNQVTIDSTDFVDYANDDYRPHRYSALHEAGKDLSHIFTDDIQLARFDRAKYPWDIGAYKLGRVERWLGPNEEFTTIQTILTYYQTNLVEASNYLIIRCRAFTDNNDTIVIQGYDCDKACRLYIESAPGSRHGGVPGAGYKLYGNVDAQYEALVDIASDYVVLDGLEVQTSSTSSSARVICVKGASGVEIRNCIIHGSNYGMGMQVKDGVSDTKIVSTLVYGVADGILLERDAVYTTLVNVSCVDVSGYPFIQKIFYGGVSEGAYPIAINCVGRSDNQTSKPAFNGGSTSVVDSTNWPISDQCWHASCTNNAGPTSEVPGANAVTNLVTADFVNYAGQDFRPAIGGSLINAGTDMSSETIQDLAGRTRG